MIFSRLSVLVLVSLLLSSCAGYRLGNVSGRSLQGVHTVYVPMVHNQSLEPSIETVATDALIRRFNNDGTLLTTSSQNADSEVDITITSVTTVPQRTTTSDVLVTAQYQLTIHAEMTFTTKRNGATVYNKGAVTGVTNFYLQNDTIEGERQALPLACEDLAKNVVSLIVEGW